MVLKFLGFAFFYLFYIALVFAGMALLVKYAYELNLENLLPPTMSMIVLLIVLIVSIALPPILFRVRQFDDLSFNPEILRNACCKFSRRRTPKCCGCKSRVCHSKIQM